METIYYLMEINSDYIINNIAKIYDLYNIPPNLRLHMLRAAVVGSILYDNWKGPEIHTKKT
ncbi:MAG: hypothetical protein ARM1_0530 [Candidatus Micrarchaeota archaeon]|nr:MAG: hypothetical protein ARM1_0530 [Candidatus Micrarchaeota archaeon]